MKIEAYENDTLLWTMDPAEVAAMPGRTPNLYVLAGAVVAYIPPAPPAPPAPVFYPAWPGRVIIAGDTGADVQAWQDRLSHLGYAIDTAGTFDNESVTITKAFQSAQGVDPTGLVDELTWEAAFHPFAGV